MITVSVLDTVRGIEESMAVDPDWTVIDWQNRLIGEFELPKQTFEREPIEYALRRRGSAEGIPLDITIGEAGIVDGSQVELVSPRGLAVWTEINRLVNRIESEVRAEGGRIVSGLRDDADAHIHERISGIGSRIESEVRGNVAGLGSKLSFRTRRRTRRWLEQIAETGSFEGEVGRARNGLQQLSSIAIRSWRAVPVAAALAVGGAGAVVVDEITDPSPEEIAREVSEVIDNGDGPGLPDESDVMAALDAINEELEAVSEQLATIEAEVPDDLANTLSQIGEKIDQLERSRPEESGPFALAVLGGVELSSPAQAVEPGGSLWAIAQRAQADPASVFGEGRCPAGPYDESLADYVKRIWASNVGTIGGDPNVVERDVDLRIPCPK